MSITSILIGTDLTEQSDSALIRALRLAKEHRAALYVVHVLTEPAADDLDGRKASAVAELEKRLGSLPESEGLEISIEAGTGKAWEALLERAASVRADLIVMGAHRRRGIMGVFRGTTVGLVLRNGRIPVLMAGFPAGESYCRVVAGVDFSESSRRAVEFAAQLTPGAEVALVHAYHVPYKELLGGTGAVGAKGGLGAQHTAQVEEKIHHEFNEFVAAVEGGGSFPKRVIREGRVHERIREEVAAADAQLLVLGTQGRGALARMMIGSVAEQLIADPPCDVLAVKVP
jgi:nucleotide-binding universal stress UspA family protein